MAEAASRDAIALIYDQPDLAGFVVALQRELAGLGFDVKTESPSAESHDDDEHPVILARRDRIGVRREQGYIYVAVGETFTGEHAEDIINFGTLAEAPSVARLVTIALL